MSIVSPTRLGFPTCDWIRLALCVFFHDPLSWAPSCPVLILSLGAECVSRSLLFVVVLVPFFTWLEPELSVETLGHCPRVVVDDEDVDGHRSLPLDLVADIALAPEGTCCIMLCWVCVSICDECDEGEFADAWES